VIICRIHGWEFDIRTGLNPDASDGFSIPCFAVEVRDGAVWVDLENVINVPKRRRRM
jgi:nitrite reductase/ring-hydroxylating ferredoxin subunit